MARGSQEFQFSLWAMAHFLLKFRAYIVFCRMSLLKVIKNVKYVHVENRSFGPVCLRKSISNEVLQCQMGNIF